ncbi:hypothetical protein ATANTOWER_000034 [Ataeniobius toweri]|uniref:Uncharacterized protein n=1 Tax=Ataeniobius toweri TaxID=208326 RepID=A0ABU7AM52_9TELE|nr:hypothetical protein [Ataeniobius toweri]
MYPPLFLFPFYSNPPLFPPGFPQTSYSSITHTHPLSFLHSPGTGTHTRSGDLHLTLLLLLQSLCIQDSVRVYVCGKSRERGGLVGGWKGMEEVEQGGMVRKLLGKVQSW